jgi:hypothetical protein
MSTEMKSASIEEMIQEAISQMGPLKRRVYLNTYNRLIPAEKAHLVDEIALKVCDCCPQLTPIFNATDFGGTTKFTVNAVDWQAIIKLILENLPSIIALIMKLFV